MAKKTIYDLKDEIVNENNEIEEVESDIDPEVVVEEVKASVQPTIFRTLKEAKSYALANGGKVKEKGKFFHVR